jgi:fructose-bisphosphate aldolase class II
MAIVSMRRILGDADAGGYAVGCYNAISLEMIRGIVAGAERVGAPVIICHAQIHFGFLPIEEISAAAVDSAARANVPVALLLDHGEDFETSLRAIQLGFNSVMLDGSKLPFTENVQLTRKVTEAAHALGATVEGELGRVTRPRSAGAMGDDEDDAATRSEMYTNIDDAVEFVRQTNVDALAAAFGTAHGVYLQEPRLDYDRIRTLRKKTGVPIVMHGGSGLTREQFVESIKSGVSKINYYSRMALRVVDRIRRELCHDGDRRVFLHDLVAPIVEEVTEEVAETCCWFGAEKKA